MSVRILLPEISNGSFLLTQFALVLCLIARVITPRIDKISTINLKNPAYE